MEERLGRVYGQRLQPLTEKELPALAEAIIMIFRRQGLVAIHDTSGSKFVRIHGNDMNVLVIERDWVKILPYLADSTLDPTVYPVPTKIGTESHIVVDSAWIQYRDDLLRDKVLGLLRVLFPKKYPRSKI